MAGAQSVGGMRNQIDQARSKINKNNGKAQVLSGTIGEYSARINSIQGSVTKLRAQEAAVQYRLDGAVARLRTIQKRHRAAETQLATLKAQLAKSSKTLARRLVDLYESDRPDLITVVLHADGFAQLIENREFLKRIGQQDREVITAVRISKAQTSSVARELASVEAERQSVATVILNSRNEIDAVRSKVEGKQQAWKAARAQRQAALNEVRSQNKHLQDHIDALQSDISSVTGQLQGADLSAGPIRQGSGQFIWPVNGPITSPFCERRAWESCHPGIDIGVPSGTPIRAAGSGVVQIAGWVGGYGNYTCIGHGGGVSTCYGHQSQLNVSVGSHVSQGQVIGISGCTGLCFGAHLHFEVRVNGSVTNPLNWL
jgi:murein DD-endopeptidase MepM/ murein hydrolase activator NlpD